MGLTGRETDRLRDRQRERQSDKKTDRQRERQSDRKKVRQRKTVRQKDRQTGYREYDLSMLNLNS